MSNQLDKVLTKQFTKRTSRSCKLKTIGSIALCMAIFFAILLPCILTNSAIAQEVPYPDPISPKDGITITKVTGIVFSWKPFYIGTNMYTFELSKNTEFPPPLIVQTTVPGGLTTYVYNGTLEYNTTYYWRVMSKDPLGDWSPVTPFKTPAPATTNNTTGTKPDTTKTGQGSIIDYIEKNMGWTLFIGIIVVLAVVAIVLVRMSKPKGPPGGQRQFQGAPPQWQGAPPGQPPPPWQGAPPGQFPPPPPPPPPNMQSPMICSFCGFPNTPDRKFCNSCGKGLFRAPPPPPPPIPPPVRPPPPPMGAFPQIVACPICHTANPPSQQFCMRCGTGLIGSGPPQQSWGAPQLPPVCPTCGTPATPGKQFCGNCGGNMSAGGQQNYQVFQTFTCPVCGGQINKGSNPCPSCGTWMDWQALLS
jgi:hypothetical protein